MTTSASEFRPCRYYVYSLWIRDAKPPSVLASFGRHPPSSASGADVLGMLFAPLEALSRLLEKALVLYSHRWLLLQKAKPAHAPRWLSFLFPKAFGLMTRNTSACSVVSIPLRRARYRAVLRMDAHETASDGADVRGWWWWWWSAFHLSLIPLPGRAVRAAVPSATKICARLFQHMFSVKTALRPLQTLYTTATLRL